MSTRASDTNPGSRSAAEIEREVNRSRAEVEHTLDQIQDRLSPGQLFDQAVTYLREGGGAEFTRNLGASIRDNPMPVALVALGVGWMMFQGPRAARYRDRSPRGYWDDDLDALEESYAGLADEDGRYLGSQADPDVAGFGDDLKAAGRAAGDKLGELGDQARQLGDRARDVSEQARERVERARSGMAHRAHEARARTRHHGSRARQSVVRSFQDQPLVLGAIGVAIGAALGAALPPTEVEDQLVGETRDEAVRRAAKVGRAQAEKVRAGAEAVVGAARDEARKEAAPGRSTPGQANQTEANLDRPSDSPGSR